MRVMRKELAVKYGLFCLALVPALLFAYLGQFSRLMPDDYKYLGKPVEIGIWQALHYFRDTWHGDYTNFLLFGLLAPLGALVPSVFPSALIVIWIAGSALLYLQVFTFLEIRRQRYFIAIALASLTVAAAINGLDTQHSFYWLSATVEYTLPPALLLICLTLMVEAAGLLHTRLRLATAALVVAAIGFVIAGFSEMYLVFQLAFLGLLIVGLSLFRDLSKRRIYFVLTLAGFLGTLASVPVQLSSPGIAYRGSQDYNYGYRVEPIRDLSALLSQTLSTTFRYATVQASFTGIGLLLAAGLFVTLTMYRAAPTNSMHHRMGGAATLSLLFGLTVQLLFVPYIWSHSSDNAQVFGRFSTAYTVVIALNAASALALLALIWQRKRFNAALNTERGFLYFCSFGLLLICLLFTMTQIRHIHYKAASYLFVQFFVVLFVLARQLTARFGDTCSNRIGLIALLSSTFAVIAQATLIGVSLWGAGYFVDRIFTSVIFLQVISGLFWGAFFGVMIHRLCLLTKAKMAWNRWIRQVSLLIVIAVGTGIVAGRIQQIDHFAAAARNWDESHQEILRLRDEGNLSVYTRKFYILYPTSAGIEAKLQRLSWVQALFYGLDQSALTMLNPTEEDGK